MRKQNIAVFAILVILSVSVVVNISPLAEAIPFYITQMLIDIDQNTAMIALIQLTTFSNQGLLIVLQSDNIVNKADIADLQNSDILALDLSPADTFTASIDKTNYTMGESITISGKVDADMRGYEVYMGFVNKDGEGYGTSTTYVLLDYSFGYIIHGHTLDNFPRGDYTLRIGSYHDEDGSDTVEIPITFY